MEIRDGNGGTAVAAALIACGLTTTFGIPGSHNLELYRALGASGLAPTSLRHEQGVGFAADGYARSTGRPAACVTTSGPGLTNLITAVATAHADSVPLLAVAPGMSRRLSGRDIGWLHELRDQRAMMAGVVDDAVRVASGDEAAEVICSAVGRWSTGRQRPVYLEIPLDVLEAPWSGVVSGPTSSRRPTLDRGSTAAAAHALANARRPVFVLGGGATSGSRELTELAVRIGAVVATTVAGKGVVAEHHPLSIGASLRVTPARQVVADADVVYCVGTEVADTDLWGGKLSPTGTVIRVDLEEGQLEKNLRADIGVHGDAAEVSAVLLEVLGASESDFASGARRAVAARELIAAATAPEGAPWCDLHDELVRAMPTGVIVAGDSAQVSYYGTVHQWPMPLPRHFLYPTGFAPLGYGLPAAIGAKLADPAKPVLALVGDGGFQFTSNELMSAVELGLNLPIIVVNNGGYGQIRREMSERNLPLVGVDISAPNFATLARSYGALGYRTADVAEVARLALRAFEADRPTLIEVTGAGTSQ